MKHLYSALLLSGTALAIGTASSAASAITYTYTGNDFTSVSSPYTKSESVTGSLTLSAPLGDNWTTFNQVYPTAFSFTDGFETISNTTPNVGSEFVFNTDAAGNITQWDVIVDVGSVYAFSINTFNSPGVYGVYDSAQHDADTEQGMVTNSPGTWSVAAVPEPPSHSLYFAGLALVGFALVRRRA